jgi:hypothetical protein
MEELQMIKGYKEMFKEQETFGFYDKIIEEAKKVEVVSYKDIPELKQFVEEQNIIGTIIPKECFKNSAMPVIDFFNTKLKYVEGLYTFHGIPIHHAWNSWNDEVYVDFTMEAQDRLQVGDSYVSCLELESWELRPELLSLGFWGPFVSYYYTEGKAKCLPFGI